MAYKLVNITQTGRYGILDTKDWVTEYLNPLNVMYLLKSGVHIDGIDMENGKLYTRIQSLSQEMESFKAKQHFLGNNVVYVNQGYSYELYRKNRKETKQTDAFFKNLDFNRQNIVINLSCATDMSNFFNFFVEDNFFDNEYSATLEAYCGRPVLNLSYFDTSRVRVMRNLFKYYDNQLIGLEKWNVSNVKNFESTFHRAKFDSLDIRKWDMRKAETMCGMFKVSTINTVNITDLDCSNVADATFLFANFCGNLQAKRVDLRNVKSLYFAFYRGNGDCYLADWNIESVTNMNNCFAYFTGYLDVSNWNTKNVKMFGSCFVYSIIESLDLSSWNIRDINNMNKCFYCATIDDLNLSGWNIAFYETTTESIFESAVIEKLDLRGWTYANGEIESYFKNSKIGRVIVSDRELYEELKKSHFIKEVELVA